MKWFLVPFFPIDEASGATYDCKSEELYQDTSLDTFCI